MPGTMPTTPASGASEAFLRSQPHCHTAVLGQPDGNNYSRRFPSGHTLEEAEAQRQAG